MDFSREFKVQRTGTDMFILRLLDEFWMIVAALSR